MNKTLPTKLAVEPVVNAIFELRFVPTKALQQAIPNLLYARFAGDVTGVQSLDANMIIHGLDGEDQTPYLAKLQVGWKGVQVMIGEKTLAVAVEGKYPGGEAFKAAICELFELVFSEGLVQQVERYSVKYINFFPADDDSFKFEADWTIEIGGFERSRENVLLRAEREDGEFRTITTIGTKVRLKVAGNPPREGAVIDIDEICIHPTDEVTEFRKEFPTRVAEVRERNKQQFFNCLTKSAIDGMGATYANDQHLKLH